MTDYEVIKYLLNKYSLSRYMFKSDLELNRCGLCNGVFFDYDKDTLFILKTK